MVYDGSMIPIIVVFGTGRCNPESIVGIAFGRDVANSKFEDSSFQGFASDQRAIEVPVSVFDLLDSAVVVELHII